MQVKLKVLTGSHEGTEIPIAGDKFLIGRSETCQLRPKSDSISRKHCILVIREGRVLIQDLKSRNGTFVNEKKLPVDRAKVLAAGDQLKIGKLSFELVVEHGLQGNKKPEVSDIGEAAERTVNDGDSRFEEVDVTGWLDEADQIDRVRKLSDPDTRQFRVDDLKVAESGSDEQEEDSSVDSTELSVNDSSLLDRLREQKKKKKGKLPDGMKKSLTESSKHARRRCPEAILQRKLRRSGLPVIRAGNSKRVDCERNHDTNATSPRLIRCAARLQSRQRHFHRWHRIRRRLSAAILCQRNFSVYHAGRAIPKFRLPHLFRYPSSSTRCRRCHPGNVFAAGASSRPLGPSPPARALAGDRRGESEPIPTGTATFVCTVGRGCRTAIPSHRAGIRGRPNA